ncbi:MAG: DNA-binding domain-containing protein, partial [Pseudomonadota bacterium]
MATAPRNHDSTDFEQAWFTASELADLGLPGLPANKRSINRRAQEERWSSRLGADNQLLVRKRSGQGGGVEYHVSLLPGESRLELARRGIVRSRPEPTMSAKATAWTWYETQGPKVRKEAERRHQIVGEIELLCQSGATRTAAVAEASADHGVGKSTLWNWLRAIEGIERSNWLPALAPRRKGGGAAAEIDDELWLLFKSDYLRNSAPTLTSVYHRVSA